MLKWPIQTTDNNPPKQLVGNHFVQNKVNIISTKRSQDLTVNLLSLMKNLLPEIHLRAFDQPTLTVSIEPSSSSSSVESSSVSKISKHVPSLSLNLNLLSSYSASNFTNNKIPSTSARSFINDCTFIIDNNIDKISTISMYVSENDQLNQVNQNEIKEEKIKTVNNKEKNFFKRFSFEKLFKKTITELKEFISNISPINIDRWKGYKFHQKIIQLMKSPSYLLMKLTIPVVDYESPKNNWCRLLNCFHIIVSPQIALFYLDCKSIKTLS